MEKIGNIMEKDIDLYCLIKQEVVELAVKRGFYHIENMLKMYRFNMGELFFIYNAMKRGGDTDAD